MDNAIIFHMSITLIITDRESVRMPVRGVSGATMRAADCVAAVFNVLPNALYCPTRE